MTIKEVAKQIYSLSVAGYVNREKFTLERLTNQLTTFCAREGVPFPVGHKYVLEVAFLDGWWHCYVAKYSDAVDGYFYWIPKTRDEEKAMLESWYKDMGIEGAV